MAARAQALKHRPELGLSAAQLDKASAGIDRVGARNRPKLAGRVQGLASPGAELIEIDCGSDAAQCEGLLLVQGTRPLEEGGSAFVPLARYGATLGLDWSLYDFGRTDALETAAEAEFRATQADQAALQARIRSEVDRAYLGWLQAGMQYQLQARGVERLKARLAELQTRVEAGTLARSVLFPLETDLAQATLNLARAEAVRNEAGRGLALATGRPIPNEAQPDVRLLNRAPPNAPAESETRPATRAIEARKSAAEATVRLYERARAPELSLSGSVGLRGQNDRFFPTYQGMVQLTIPIWDGGESAARAREAQAEARMLALRKAEEDAAEKRRRTRASHLLAEAERRVALAERWRQMAEARLTDAKERFSEAKANSNEVGQAQRAQQQAEGALLLARVDRIRAILAME